jgi:hypothetical protein
LAATCRVRARIAVVPLIKACWGYYIKNLNIHGPRPYKGRRDCPTEAAPVPGSTSLGCRPRDVLVEVGWARFRTPVISINDRNALYLIDGMCNHETDLNMQEHFTDTNGLHHASVRVVRERGLAGRRLGNHERSYPHAVHCTTTVSAGGCRC